MTQPIEEGMVLGGRYLITGHVLTSADQDMVLDGRDQVLNRDVSILVASAAHASQVAASARELATGERQGTVQVLDLGLSEGRTYLIAGGNPSAEDLLSMTSEQQVYVEPFYTDTLGSEIFGEARTYEPQVYEDDEEYYEDLDDGLVEEETEKRRPKFLRGISDRLSQRLGSEDAAQDAVAGGSGGTGAGAAGVAGAAGIAGAGAARNAQGHDAGSPEEPEPYRAAVLREDEQPLPESVSDDDWTGTQDEVTVDRDRATAQKPAPAAEPVVESADEPVIETDQEPVVETHEEPASEQDSEQEAEQEAEQTLEPVAPQDEATDQATDQGPETDETPTSAVASPAIGRHSPRPEKDQQQRAADRPKVTLWEDDEPERERDRAVSAGLAAGAVAGGVGGAAAVAHPGGFDPEEPAYEDLDEDAEFGDDYDEEDEEDKPTGSRWLVGGILVLLLILGAVFAFNILGNNRSPEAGGESSGGESGAQSGSASQDSAPDSELPDPVIVGATRLVPDDPALSAETDNTLPNAVDGNPATAWQTYSFAQPSFGGYASNLALVIELEEPSAVSQVDITQNNGSGGSFSVLLSDSPSLDGARQIAEGSFTGPEVSVPVPADEGGPAEAQYVILNFTELPQLSNASGNLPYGLRIAEVAVE
ncbi:hypothetical protein [Microbacterium sp. A93]|uniref:hypothetical protein n=1 Tax=Microbacterium sp. A93 TaxID=3450716 RepID=UPI003F4247D6